MAGVFFPLCIKTWVYTLAGFGTGLVISKQGWAGGDGALRIQALYTSSEIEDRGYDSKAAKSLLSREEAQGQNIKINLTDILQLFNFACCLTMLLRTVYINKRKKGRYYYYTRVSPVGLWFHLHLIYVHPITSQPLHPKCSLLFASAL
ncbi:hypothetical protein QBC47DRAFT_42978 [Echria macrotheca]|uniref:Uncharacterized protein n=1 Tax=Echria macrotheca TaxID=438768 RepID=A0AAJ0B9X5_9PEZI|nr:hypothetical protein QBC47DRAFT_42978 [Echria macrotheca]